MTLKECLDYIHSDYYRITGRRNVSFLKIYTATLLDVGFRFLFWFRLAKWQSVCGLFARVIYRGLMQKHHIIIERDSNIGYGFRIVHGGPCVVNSSAK